ncbi:MAG: glycosyltransferase family 4 protein [Candidatus Omnitrophica bacterium]|nr:glycosyltransferase family 4 protein [Candidatus Omnitrophota bacterium]
MKILFVGHNATRSGAPIILKDLTEWFFKNGHKPDVLLIRDGPLLNPYRLVAKIFVLKPDYLWRRSKTHPRLWIRTTAKALLYLHQTFLRLRFMMRKYDVIYLNTMVCGEVFKKVLNKHCPVICHVHELAWVMSEHEGARDKGLIKDNTDHYIAASGAVKNYLIQDVKIPASQIDVFYEFTRDEIISMAFEKKHPSIRQELNIPQEAWVIVSGGSIEWRKGADLFIQLANHLNREIAGRLVYFLWVGPDVQGGYFMSLNEQLNAGAHASRYRFAGEKENPYPYFAEADLFVLMSREDPFPVVCLEAALLKKPILCFKDSGGMSEFVEDDSGAVVSHLDVKAMAGHVSDLLADDVKRNACGIRAAEKVRSGYLLDHQIPMIYEKILKWTQENMKGNV